MGQNLLIGPEPIGEIAYSLIPHTLQQWVSVQHRSRVVGIILAKSIMPIPDNVQASDALRLNIRVLRKVVGFITGHWEFCGYLNKMGVHITSFLCRKWGEEEDKTLHVITLPCGASSA